MKSKFTTSSILVISILVFAVLFSPVKAESTFSSSADIDISKLKGTWILKDIKSTESVEIYASPNQMQKMETIDGNTLDKMGAQKVSIPLKKILKSQLSLNLSKFIFSNQSFDFYRKATKTFTGNWTYNDGLLTLIYTSNQEINKKENKILSLTDNKLVIESESYNKKVIFVYEK
ncbi:MAG: hypothetical protein IT237_09955 [Bacteroidia bacterium]|nr:hypothetical protein [Bacteroidia bacterium]